MRINGEFACVINKASIARGNQLCLFFVDFRIDTARNRRHFSFLRGEYLPGYRHAGNARDRLSQLANGLPGIHGNKPMAFAIVDRVNGAAVLCFRFFLMRLWCFAGKQIFNISVDARGRRGSDGRSENFKIFQRCRFTRTCNQTFCNAHAFKLAHSTQRRHGHTVTNGRQNHNVCGHRIASDIHHTFTVSRRRFFVVLSFRIILLLLPLFVGIGNNQPALDIPAVERGQESFHIGTRHGFGIQKIGHFIVLENRIRVPKQHSLS